MTLMEVIVVYYMYKTLFLFLVLSMIREQSDMISYSIFFLQVCLE